MTEKHFDVIICGAGLSGLCAAHFIKKNNPEKTIAIFEKETRTGGAVKSAFENGFLAEYGPHGFLDNIEESRELLDDLKESLTPQKASLKDFVRYLCLGQRLCLVPQSPPKIIRSGIMPLTGKLRVLGDLIKKPLAGEPTAAQWAEYRFGKSILPIVDAVLTGTYAGDMERLSIDAIMPALRRFEFERGSVFKGVIKQQKEKKAARQTGGLPSMVSFKNGMEELTKCLGKKYPAFLGDAVQTIKKGDDWQVKTQSGMYVGKNLVLALPVNQALELLRQIDSPPVEKIPVARINNVMLGFDSTAQIPFGFGYLAPRTEKRFTLGALFSTHMFPGRAPGDAKLLEALVGGRLYPKKLDLDDETTIKKALDDIGQLISLPEKAIFSKVLRPDHGIPQLETGHLKLQEFKTNCEENHPGLKVIGFGWNGIGINDMIKDAKKTGDFITKGESASEQDKAKGIYV